MATHSSVLAWRIPWTEEPGGLHAVHGVTKSDITEHKHTHTLTALRLGQALSTIPLCLLRSTEFTSLKVHSTGSCRPFR